MLFLSNSIFICFNSSLFVSYCFIGFTSASILNMTEDESNFSIPNNLISPIIFGFLIFLNKLFSIFSTFSIFSLYESPKSINTNEWSILLFITWSIFLFAINIISPLWFLSFVVFIPKDITSPVLSFIVTISPIVYWFSIMIDIPDSKSFNISWNANPAIKLTIPSEAIIVVVSIP